MISWDMVGGDIPPSLTTEGNVLRSESLTSDSAGLYRCTVETRKGKFYKMFTLALTGDM